MAKALGLIDIQWDFVYGSFKVPDANEVVDRISDFLLENESNYDVVFFTGDYHPENHSSFGKFPEHCVAGNKGSDFLFDEKENHAMVFLKGQNKDVEAFSAFFNEAGEIETNINRCLTAQGITEIDMVGITAPFCITRNAIDAVKLGYKVNVHQNLITYIGDRETCLKELTDNGVNVI